MITVESLKNYLNITYKTDHSIEQKLDGILQRAREIIRDYAGIPAGEEFDGADEELIYNLCRYIWNGAYEDFRRNFSAELIQLRAKYAVKEDEKNDGEGLP